MRMNTTLVGETPNLFIFILIIFQNELKLFRLVVPLTPLTLIVSIYTNSGQGNGDVNPTTTETKFHSPPKNVPNPFSRIPCSAFVHMIQISFKNAIKRNLGLKMSAGV